MKLPQSKRLKFAIAVLIMNFIVFLIGIFNYADLSDLGVGLAMINTPVIGYILADTWRPSGYISKGMEKEQPEDI